MRTIKFRCWNKEKEKMYDWETITGAKKDGTIYWISLQDSKNILMQFTGLLDKNGKEIYEGDIISTPYFIMGKDSGSKEIKKVVFHKGMFGVFGSNAYSFIELNGLYTGKEETKKYIPNFGEIYEETEAVFEVIGNIYENAELLTNQ